MRIAVAGASGFVGRNLLGELSRAGHEVFALSRSAIAELPPRATWRKTDLFSAQSTHSALEGADCAIYLIHSMLPSTALFQGDFHDTDLLLADNFARACRAHGIRRIVYLGGLVPEGRISLHLESRREVEKVLESSGVPVTVLRAGMIVGPGGSSFEILQNLVRRLPAMLLPEWTQRTSQAVFIDDAVRVIARAAEDDAFVGQTLDLVNGEALTYELLLRQMAEALQVRREMIRVPIRSTEFSKLWVTLFSDSDYELVSPLIDSLLCDLPSSKPGPLIEPLIRFKGFKEMAIESLARQTARPSSGPGRLSRALSRRRRRMKTVRSIQRLPSLADRDAHWIATEYMRWLPNNFLSLIQVNADESTGRVIFRIRGIPVPLLELQFVQRDSDRDRNKFHIVGGLLTRTTDTGWLEFRQVSGRSHTIAAIHEFVPSLPWPVYLCTQAVLHAWTMNRFGRHLSARAEKP